MLLVDGLGVFSPFRGNFTSIVSPARVSFSATPFTTVPSYCIARLLTTI